MPRNNGIENNKSQMRENPFDIDAQICIIEGLIGKDVYEEIELFYGHREHEYFRSALFEFTVGIVASKIKSGELDQSSFFDETGRLTLVGKMAKGYVAHHSPNIDGTKNSLVIPEHAAYSDCPQKLSPEKIDRSVKIIFDALSAKRIEDPDTSHRSAKAEQDWRNKEFILGEIASSYGIFDSDSDQADPRYYITYMTLANEVQKEETQKRNDRLLGAKGLLRYLIILTQGIKPPYDSKATTCSIATMARNQAKQAGINAYGDGYLPTEVRKHSS